MLQVLRQNRIFDRTEESRMYAHCDQRGQHQRNVGNQQPSRPHQHDSHFSGFDPADELRLVARIRELPCNCRQQEKR